MTWLAAHNRFQKVLRAQLRVILKGGAQVSLSYFNKLLLLHMIYLNLNVNWG